MPESNARSVDHGVSERSLLDIRDVVGGGDARLPHHRDPGVRRSIQEDLLQSRAPDAEAITGREVGGYGSGVVDEEDPAEGDAGLRWNRDAEAPERLGAAWPYALSAC